ncbi:MAG TPA: hypothetical protein PLM53_05020 [Spirochaetota bacterium]|nr:hypothetical protein [Spirochaetota bacterium]HPC40611.1 hypothetical protein [Spirochaetota bacterium]HPL18204.1 hypothetical protein [Spirochaetota bacterium]HQF07881.1 hypothetical protein [Spirochaetota bacterium]HQH96440.1 hypothetical protein [Spirochaetota bacterium]
MVTLNKINLEYKSTVLFGFTALLLSFIVGMIAGVRWNVVLLRSLLLMAVFAVIGFGVSYIFKKYVPEIYELVSSLAALPGGGKEGETAAVPGSGEASAESMEFEARDAGGGGDASEGQPSNADFRELEKEGLSHYSTTPGGAGSIHTKSGKLGKHILESEKLAKYEPKIMAQAVRTMMGKDRE